MKTLGTPFVFFFLLCPHFRQTAAFLLQEKARMTSAVAARAADILQRRYRQTSTFTTKPHVHVWHEDSHPIGS